MSIGHTFAVGTLVSDSAHRPEAFAISRLGAVKLTNRFLNYSTLANMSF